MFALMRLIEGLVVAHLFLGATFLVGTSAFPWCERSSAPVPAPQMMMRLVCTCGLGIAILGVALFLLALTRLFAPPAMLMLIIVFIAAESFFWKSSPFSKRYWAARLRVVRESFDLSLAAVYGVAVLASVPAILPNPGGDPIHYHLAYAQDFASAKGLVVDPFLRFAFYPSYFNLFFAALLSLHGSSFVNFLTVSTALLTSLGICAASSVALENVARKWASLISIALTFAVILSPVFLRWGTTAYMDVELGAMALLMTLSVQLAFLERQRGWLWAGAVMAGYLVGMKSSFLVLAPFFLLALVFAARSLSLRRRHMLALIALFIAVASPWYVRDTVLSGDPVAPIINNTIYGHDGLVTKPEWDAIMLDLRSSRSVSDLFALPVRAFLSPRSPDYREYGITALIIFLFVPSLSLFGVFCLGGKLDPVWVWPIFILSGLIAYWLASSTQLRYGLVLYPLLAVCCALSLALLLRKIPKLAGLAACVAVMAMLTSPNSAEFYRDLFRNDYQYISARFTNEDQYLRINTEGFSEEEYVSNFYKRRNMAGDVYALGGATEYYFRRHGIISMGDWVGPAGYFRLYQAIDAGRSAAFLSALNARAILIDPSFAFGGLDVPLERELIRAGFCDVPVPRSRYQFLVNEPCRALSLHDTK